MKIYISRFFFVFFNIVLISAQVPQKLSYQGLLTDASGNPLCGSHTVLLNFYTTSTAIFNLTAPSGSFLAENGCKGYAPEITIPASTTGFTIRVTENYF